MVLVNRICFVSVVPSVYWNLEQYPIPPGPCIEMGETTNEKSG